MTKLITAFVCGFLCNISLQQLARASSVDHGGNSCYSIQRNLGEPFEFVCPDSHRGRSYFYHYSSTTQQYELVYNNSHRYHTTIESLDDAGEYYCTKHRGDTLLANRSHCVRVEVPTMIHWNLSKDALLHSNITGSCTLISNPLPMSDLDVLTCDYRSSTIVVDKYTVTINFIIYNITQSCHIYCYSANYFEKKLLMVSTVVTMNTTDISSLLPMNTITTSIPNPTVTSHQTTPNSIPTTSTIPSPRTKEEVKKCSCTHTDTDATIVSLLILAVVAIFLLMIITFVTLMFIIWISFKGITSKTPVV